jgi:hypothetical protein
MADALMRPRRATPTRACHSQPCSIAEPAGRGWVWTFGTIRLKSATDHGFLYRSALLAPVTAQQRAQLTIAAARSASDRTDVGRGKRVKPAQPTAIEDVIVDARHASVAVSDRVA